MSLDFDTFERKMAEMMKLLKQEREILDSLFTGLGIDPDEVRAQQERERQEKVRERSERRQRRRGDAPAPLEEDVAVPTRTVSDDARNVLARCEVGDDFIKLPAGQLDRHLYEEVNAVLESLGGKWARGQKVHVFTDPTGQELADVFYTVVEMGTWERAQDAGYYPTPAWLVERMIASAAIEGFHRALEPSAGQGAILLPLAKKLQSRHQLAVCELLPENQKVLTQLGFTVDATDFLELQTGAIFDRVVMNPPFSRSQAPAHVLHAISLLKPGGRLVAIMPNGIMQRQDKLHRQVRQEIISHGTITPLPDSTFKDVGTMVRTVMVVYDKPGDDGKNGRGSLDQPMPPAAQQAQDARSEPQEPPETPEVPTTPARRFQRLSDAPRRFARPKRRS